MWMCMWMRRKRRQRQGAGDAAERAGHVGIAVRMRRAVQHPAVREPLALPVATADHQHVRHVRTEVAFRGVQTELHEIRNNAST